jgi:hypothetical protein
MIKKISHKIVKLPGLSFLSTKKFSGENGDKNVSVNKQAICRSMRLRK